MNKTNYIYANTNGAALNEKELFQSKCSGKIVREFKNTSVLSEVEGLGGAI
jgi:hypothetical protein